MYRNPTSVTDWWKPPLSTRLPCGPTALPANCPFVDSVYTAYISGWMNNLIGEGENGTIYRNDSILFLMYALSGMTSFSRDVSELSTKNTTRSDQTQMYNNTPLINVEEKSDEIENARYDLVRKFELPFVFGIAISIKRFHIYLMTSENE